MIAAIYAQKSNDQTDVADEEKSVTRQVERARQYAERKGWTVDPAAIFIDDSKSGADFVRREGFLRLMNALKPRPPFQALVMMEQSRLGRSLAEVPYAIRQIARAGVRIHCYLTDSEIKSETLVDEFQSNVMAFVDQMHREQSRQRTRDALRRHAERGYVAGGLVFGYRNHEVRVGDKRSHVLREIDPDQAEVVRRIFRDVARGDGFCRIAKRLNVEGVPSPRPKKHGWAVSGVREIALRDLYRGLVIYGKTRWKDRDRDDQTHAKSAKRKVPCPPSEWITTEAAHLRIVDEPLWAAAQARLGATRATYARLTDGRLVGRPAADRGPGHLLTGFLHCVACNGPVFCQKHTSRKGGPRLYYVCATQRTRGTCPGGGLRIDREALDAAVLDAIEAAVLSPDHLVALVDRILARAARGPALGERRATLERQLREARARIERYVRALGDGLDVEGVRTELTASKATAHALEVELAGLGAAAAPVIDRALVARRVADWRGILHRGPVLARQILRKIFPGVRPLALTPAEDGGVAFTGSAAGASILAGLANVTMVVPPG